MTGQVQRQFTTPPDAEGGALSRRVLRAVAHPVRLEMLARVTNQAMSAAELARELHISQPLASYHLRQLIEAKLVTLHSERMNRGATERLYRASDADHSRNLAGHASDMQVLLRALSVNLLKRGDALSEEMPSLFADAEVWAREADIRRLHRALEQAISEFVTSAVPPSTEGAEQVAATALLLRLRPR